jgi:putative alpha-1,2-mannosidase
MDCALTGPQNTRAIARITCCRIGGQDYGSPWIPWKLVRAGVAIEFALGESPNTTWGVASETAPPSFDGQ